MKGSGMVKKGCDDILVPNMLWKARRILGSRLQSVTISTYFEKLRQVERPYVWNT